MAIAYEDYAHLVPHVLRTHFLWTGPWAAVKSSHFDVEDLMQEGRVGLLEAMKNYDAEHAGNPKFITYAYYCIYWAIYRYIDANLTSITLRGFRRDMERNGEHAKARFFRAMGIHPFSYFKQPFPWLRMEDLIVDRGAKLDLTDEEEHAWEKIQQMFSTEELDVVLQRYGGLTYEKLGEYLECSRETARKTVLGILDRIDEYVRKEVRNEAG